MNIIVKPKVSVSAAAKANQTPLSPNSRGRTIIVRLENTKFSRAVSIVEVRLLFKATKVSMVRTLKPKKTKARGATIRP